jgi:alcohol dehydrogenase
MGAVVAGANPIFGVDPVASKRELAVELGATATFDPGQAETAIRELTGGGVRYAFETAGRAPVLESAYRTTGRGGVTVAVGLPDPAHVVSIQAAALVGEARTLVGSYMGSSVPQRDVPRYLDLWAAGHLPIERLHSGALSLSSVGEGMDRLAEGDVLRQTIRPHAS